MMMSGTPRDPLLQQELATLREMTAMLQAQLDGLKAENEQLRQHNAVLRLKVDAMARKLFGQSSEKLDPEQLQMVFDTMQSGPLEEAKKPGTSEVEACAEVNGTSSSGNAQRKRRTLEELIDDLPVSEVIIDPAEVKAEPEAWSCIGAEVSDAKHSC